MIARLLWCAVFAAGCAAMTLGADSSVSLQNSSAAVPPPATDFATEGVAEPVVLRARNAGRSPERLNELIVQQAGADALAHLSAYARGLTFRFQVAPDGQPTFALGRLEYQPTSGTLPKSREFRMLGSGLGLGRLTYEPCDLPRLNVRPDLFKLPVYRVSAAYVNPTMQTTIGNMHWSAVRECYQKAIMMQILKAYGNRPVSAATGRVFPAQTLSAELIALPPAPPPEGAATDTSATDTPAATASPAPAPTTSAAAPAETAAATASAEPAATAAPAESAAATTAPAADSAVPATAAPASAASATPTTTAASAESAATAVPASASSSASSAAPPSSAATKPAEPEMVDSRTVEYRLTMDIRVEISDAKFADDPPATAASAAPATTAPDPAVTATSAAAPPVAPATAVPPTPAVAPAAP